MADPISSLADQLLALINSSPRTPTKAEIEGILRTLPEIMHPLVLVERMNAEAELCPPTSSILTDADLESIAGELCSAIEQDEEDRATYRKFAAEKATALKLLSAQASERMERRAVEIFNDLPQGSVCCPGSIDGSHSWTTNDAKGLRCQEGSEWDKGGPYWCPCGASKP